MPEKTVMKYLEDIRDYSQKAIDYLNNITYEEFLKDNKTIDAAIRTIEVVGEAATKIKNMPNSSDIFEKYNYVDWKEAVRMRNRIIHGYEDIDLEIVWNTVKTDFPKLKNNIEKVIKEVKEQINPTPVEKEPVKNKPEIKPTQEIKRKFRR
ncbi:MAG: HepT-like ribonuclease domain-containing protein [bacterium]